MLKNIPNEQIIFSRQNFWSLFRTNPLPISNIRQSGGLGEKHPFSNKNILIKGSRSTRMEKSWILSDQERELFVNRLNIPFSNAPHHNNHVHNSHSYIHNHNHNDDLYRVIQ